jgi:hypothetical protein
MLKRNYPRWTILSILGLLITLVLVLFFDKALWRILIEHVISGIFILPHLFNALADIIIPIAVVLLFWIIPRANGENKVAPVFYIFVWFLFLIIPTIVAAFPTRIRFNLPPWLPFDIWDTMVGLKFPFSRLHFVSGFALSIGITGASDRLRKLIFQKEPRVTQRNFPLRTVLSLIALAATFALTLFLNYLLLWAFDKTLIEMSFFEFFVIGASINTILPIVIALLFWVAYQTLAESRLASWTFFSVGCIFVLLPIVMAVTPSLNRIRPLRYLPFLPVHSLLDFNAPYSLLYYFLGFVLIIGIIGIYSRIQSFLLRKATNSSGEHPLTEKE